MKYKILRLGMLITMCVFFVINTMEVYAITSPPSTDLVQAFSGDDKANFDENTDIYFIYSDIPISKIESEDELKNIIEQANTDELDTHRGAWVVRQWQTQEREYFERVLV